MKQKTLTAVLDGQYGKNAAIATALSLHNNAAFSLKQAVFQGLRKEAKNVTYDASKLAALGIGTKGGPDDNGTEKPKTVDLIAAAEYLAATFVMLARFSIEPNPDNKGRVETGLQSYLRDVDAVMADAVEWAADKSDDAMNIRAKAKALKYDDATLKTRLDSLRSEKVAQFTEHFKPAKLAYTEALKVAVDADWSDLFDTCSEFLTDSGTDPFKFAVDCAKANMDRQRKRDAEGKYTRIDMGIFALSES